MLLFLFACTPSEIDWKALYRKPQEFEIQINQQEPMLQESIWLSMLSAYPEDVQAICQHIQSDMGKQTCNRYKNRPHLQTIPSQEIAYWNGGRLDERLLFPRDFALQAFSFEMPLENPCTSPSLNNQLCLQNAGEKALYSDWKMGAWYCSQMQEPLAQSDCFFHLSEQLPVHLDNFEGSARLCALSKGFSGECHNHLLIRYASKFWTKLEWHLGLIEQFESLWGQEYAVEITDAYWSIVAFRVVGMMMPLEVKEFLEWPKEFQPYLYSAIALRVWDQSYPIQAFQRALKKEPLRVGKARGPGAPRFSPRHVWGQIQSSKKWTRFCDIRGGSRPVHSDPEIDMIWALLTASALSDPLEIAFWDELRETDWYQKWEIRWAMAKLLKEISPNHLIFKELQRDSDIRVYQATQ